MADEERKEKQKRLLTYQTIELIKNQIVPKDQKKKKPNLYIYERQKAYGKISMILWLLQAYL